MRIRRARFLYFSVDDTPFLDIARLLRGKISVTKLRNLHAVALLTGQDYPVSIRDLQMLLSLSTDRWTTSRTVQIRHGLQPALMEEHARRGLVITDSLKPELAAIRRHDECLSATQWNRGAALYHFMGRWENVDVHAQFPDDRSAWAPSRSGTGKAFRQFLKRHGYPPPAFYSRRTGLPTVPLPLKDHSGQLFELLKKRHTTRAFDPSVPLDLATLGLLLYYVFGCHGSLEVYKGVLALHKTSPSGGSLHPTEVYPLLINVSDVAPGLYHYNVETHALECLHELNRAAASELANEFTAGQDYPRRAQALFIMTARFYRTFWKYRQHHRAYAVVLMDAAHLSQSFYLVCEALGLGAFVTAAINAVNVERRLDIDGFEQGALAICGCGAPASRNNIDPVFRPYRASPLRADAGASRFAVRRRRQPAAGSSSIKPFRPDSSA